MFSKLPRYMNFGFDRLEVEGSLEFYLPSRYRHILKKVKLSSMCNYFFGHGKLLSASSFNNLLINFSS